MTQPGAHSLPTKLLHGVLALAVTYQLAFIGFVERPRNGAPGNLFYQFHEIVGLTTLGVVSAFWVWVLVRRGETSWPALFPWFSSMRLRALVADLGRHWAALRQFKLPKPEELPLATTVHGLGLLTVTAMAVTGAAFALLGLPKDQARLVLEIHKLIANLMWAYLIGHAGLAVLHQFVGQPILKRIFGRGAP
ncbi:MAG: cytochrome b/b6 domain-containing protein [Sulfuricella sp.]